MNTYENKYSIIVSRFNEFITEKLLEGCLNTLMANKIDKNNINIVKVPGAFEIPTACKWIIDENKYSAIITLGCVIRGETSHYDHICNAVSTEINYLGVLTGIPVIFGILTCENIEQALDRAGGKKGNKGSEAALAAIEMISVLKEIKSAHSTNPKAFL